MLITVAIPCYRSENTIEHVVNEIREVISVREGYDYQIILVNDCSPDNVMHTIKKICANDKKVQGINLNTNSGQAMARMAALSYVKGDVLIYMDDDGETPAKELFKLVEKIESGYDVVYAKLVNKKHKLIKRMTSALNSKILEYIGTKPKGISMSSYFAMTNFCAKQLLNYGSPYPLMAGYLVKISNKIANVEIEHQVRLSGSSGYTFRKLFMLWLTGFTSFSVVPLRVASVLGFFTAFCGALSGVILVIEKLLHPSVVMGYTSLMAALLLIGGIIMIILGLMGEYIGRIYMTISDTPRYVIREEINVMHEE